MIELKVVTLTNNPAKYPEHAAASQEHANLVDYVGVGGPTPGGEVETFVIDPRDGSFWGADEFFACVRVTRFLVDPAEL